MHKLYKDHIECSVVLYYRATIIIIRDTGLEKLGFEEFLGFGVSEGF